MTAQRSEQTGRNALMRMILVGTDLSSRSDRALHRAAFLARQFKARLLLLHVVDDDQPPALVDQDKRQATAVLDEQALHMAEFANARPDVLVELGDPFEVIVKTARTHKADLIVMGAHRKRALRDIFVGTTIERVMRTGNTPVLMVNAHPDAPYRRLLLAIDMSDASARAAQSAKALGLLDAAEVSILHAFRPYAKSMLGYVGANQDVVTNHVVHTALEAAGEVTSFLKREGMDDERYEILLEEGDPFGTIKDAVKRRNPNLLVIGTRGHTGLKRILLGSVADEALRQIECDVLAVPPDQALIAPSSDID
jgi:nucleotide-binding universal stress UspA family protein